MSTYRVTYTIRRNYPAGGTYLADVCRRDLVASDSRTARDAIRALNPGCKITSVRDLEAAYEAKIRRAEKARNR